MKYLSDSLYTFLYLAIEQQQILKEYIEAVSNVRYDKTVMVYAL